MTTDSRIASRADSLLPEEKASGSSDPEAQAAATLADSDERQESRDVDDDVEHRRSEETVEPS